MTTSGQTVVQNNPGKESTASRQFLAGMFLFLTRPWWSAIAKKSATTANGAQPEDNFKKRLAISSLLVYNDQWKHKLAGRPQGVGSAPRPHASKPGTQHGNL